MSSSFVGITQAETLASRCGDPRTSSRVRLGIHLDAEPRGGFADSAADLGGVLADAGGEDEAVDAAQHGGERSDLLGGAVHEVIHGQPGVGLACS